MHFGLWLGTGFISTAFTILFLIIVIFLAGWLLFATPFGLVVLGGLVIYGFYRIYRFFKENAV